MLTQTTYYENTAFSCSTRFNNELWQKEIQCSHCGGWVRIRNNPFCHYCAMWLTTDSQPVVETVVEASVIAQVEAIMQADIAAGQAQGLIVTSAHIASDGSGYAIEWSNPEPVAVVEGLDWLSDEYEARKVAGSKGKQYDLVARQSNHMAVDCTCPDRAHRGRLQGRACKHMMAHNNALKPATAVVAA